MADLTVTPKITLTLSSAEFVLISKGLAALMTEEGDRPLPAAQELRDSLTRKRAKQTLSFSRLAESVLEALPPEDHVYE